MGTMGSGTESVENAVGVKIIIGFIVGIICLMVGGDVFHVHSEQALLENASAWNDRINELKRNMTQWQYENLDMVIPEIVVAEFEDKEETFKHHFLGPLQTGDQWEAVSYQANNFYIWPWAMEQLANFSTESTLDCRLACLADYSCGSWFHYGHFCGHW